MTDSKVDTVNYLLDLVTLLKEFLADARKRRDELGEGNDRSFEAGRARAYAEAITLVHHQAVSFGVPLGSIGLERWDEDREEAQ